MTQNFKNPYPLIEVLENFGKKNKTQPANYRYTEVKLSKYGKVLLKYMHSANVPFYELPGIVDKKKIEYLPGDFPNVFCNGNSNLLPHNYRNVVEMLNAYKDNTEIKEDKLIKLIGIPEFADERILLNPEVLPSIYKTGKGIIKYKYSN